MDIKTVDLLVLFVLAILVSFIITYSVVWSVNQKLNNLKINIPQSVCPRPHIFIKTANGQYIKAPVQQISQSSEYSDSTDSGSTYSDGSSSYETFDVMKEDPNATPYLVTGPSQLDREIISLTSGFTGQRDVKNLRYPNADDIVRYDNNGCYENVKTRSIQKVTKPAAASQPVQVNKQLTIPLKPGQPPYNLSRPALCQQLPRGDVDRGTKIITADGKIANTRIDYYIPQMYMDKYPYINSHNYVSTTYKYPAADTSQIGSIPVNDYRGSPKPYGSNV